jgi:hypothetical protein
MRIQLLLAGAAVAGMASLATTTVNAANLISNGGFETGDFTDWTLFDNTGFTGVDGNFSGVDPTEGNYQAYFGPVGSTGGISQAVSTSGGSVYTISFDLFNFGGTTAIFSADFGGSNLLALSDPSDFPYTHYSFTRTAAGSSTTLSFTTQQDPSYWLLDNVSVTPGGVPEPAAWALMLTGFFGLGAALRNNRRQAVLSA